MPIVTINRRRLLKTASALIAAPAILRVTRASAQDATFKIGFVSPQTGPIAGFGEADGYILEGINKAFAGGIDNNGKKVAVEIITKDSQSNPNRAAEVASELILQDKVNLIVASATPDTTNPVADQAELNEVPCITTNCPWQPYFFGRGGDPAKGFEWTYHFFWGLEDIIANFIGIWDQSGVAKKVGGLFPNDADGNAWGDPKLGLPDAACRSRLHAHRSGPLPAAQQRLHLADLGLQGGRLRDRDRRDDPAGLRHLLEPGGAAGLQSQGRHHRQGACSSPRRSRRWAIAATG